MSRPLQSTTYRLGLASLADPGERISLGIPRLGYEWEVSRIAVLSDTAGLFTVGYNVYAGAVALVVNGSLTAAAPNQTSELLDAASVGPNEEIFMLARAGGGAAGETLQITVIGEYRRSC